MSVGTRRLAAAQRTAVGTNPSRARRLGAWIVIVPALGLFSFSVVAGAAGFRGTPRLESAASGVVPQTRGEAPAHAAGGAGGGNGSLALVGSSTDGGGLGGLFGKGGREVCWISSSQLARVSAAYRTSTATISLGGRTYPLVTVYGADEKGLMNLLGYEVKCRLVHAAHLFFLPFDGNLS